MCQGFFLCFVVLISLSNYFPIECVQPRTGTLLKTELECEFPPRMEEDLTHVRRKRLTTESGLVCLEDYPYTVSVRMHHRHWCGGAIVGTEWVLTAAQCFDYVSKEEVTVRMGSVFRDFGGRILGVTDIVRHPEYRMDLYYPEHNLAMVKLNVPIVPGSRVQIVKLAASNAELPARFGEIVVTGYGSTSGQIREGENQELRRMIVEEIERPSCRMIYGNDYRLQRDHVCLQSVQKGVALCSGDTGDPAVHFSGVSRGGTLYGIALFSGTEECAYKSKPGVYAKISYSRSWIESLMFTPPKKIDQMESADSGYNGDTGDPAVHFSGVSRGGTLYGIALFSGTEECAYKSKPGVYAKISYSRSWIESLMFTPPKKIDQMESADSGYNVIPLSSN